MAESGMAARNTEHIVFLERSTFTVEFRRPSFPHTWVDYPVTHPSEVVERLRDATIAICNKLPLRADALALLPVLRLIAVAATGVDNIDLGYCREHNIAVCNGRNYATTSLPEHVLTLVLALRRNLLRYRADVLSGRWQSAKQFCLLDYPIDDLNGSTLGVVGYGALGQATARLARMVGMNVVVAEHKNAARLREGRTSFEDTLRLSDVLSLHCPLTDETRNLISTPELMQMKPGSILINTARGALIDDEALIEALRTGRLGGAGIDVLRNEPPVSGNRILELELPNLIVTPHVAWASRQSMQILADQVVDNLEAFVRGEPQNLVD